MHRWNESNAVKVNVLLSSYNGEKYLQDQIQSIFSQEEDSQIEVVLTIRDDGSTDHTPELLKEFEKQYLGKIHLFLEENVGYRRSFLRLLSLTEEADYYAFSDQDDVWKNEKLSRAISFLRQNEDMHLYVSALINTDEDLNPISTQTMTKHNSLESIFVRNRLPGCCMVFDSFLRNAATNLQINEDRFVPSHDMIISVLASMNGGILIDDEPTVFHRRTVSSITAGDGKLRKRLKAEWKVVFINKHECSILADVILQSPLELTEEQRRFLETVSKSRTDRRARKILLQNPDFSCGVRSCDMETKFKVLIGNF